MIVTEFYMEREDGVNLYRTYSDAGFKIRKVITGEAAEPYEAGTVPDEPVNVDTDIDPAEPEAVTEITANGDEELYNEAIDIEDSGNVYEETDIPVDEEVSPEEALRILLGGEDDETT